MGTFSRYTSPCWRRAAPTSVNPASRFKLRSARQSSHHTVRRRASGSSRGSPLMASHRWPSRRQSAPYLTSAPTHRRSVKPSPGDVSVCPAGRLPDHACSAVHGFGRDSSSVQSSSTCSSRLGSPARGMRNLRRAEMNSRSSDRSTPQDSAAGRARRGGQVGLCPRRRSTTIAPLRPSVRY